MSAREFRDVLKTLRKKAGLTQIELAKRLGVYQSMVARWENGQGEPVISLVKPLAAALGVGVEKLLDLPAPAARKRSRK